MKTYIFVSVLAVITVALLVSAAYWDQQQEKRVWLLSYYGITIGVFTSQHAAQSEELKLQQQPNESAEDRKNFDIDWMELSH